MPLYHHKHTRPESIPLSGLICYFNMDDTGSQAVDSVNGVTMSAAGNMINSVKGVKNTCWQAGAQGDYLSGTQSAFTLPSNFTLNLWVYVSAAVGYNATVFEFGDYSDNNGFGFYMQPSSGKISGRMKQDFDQYGSGVISNNTWTMLTMTYDGSYVKTYINGVQDKSRSYSTSVATTTKLGAFSRSATSGQESGEYFLGKLDEIGLWDYAMPTSGIKDLMNLYTTPLSTSGFDDLGHSIAFTSAQEAGCVFIDVPKEGLLYYASLNGSTPYKAETGQTLQLNGSISYTTADGIPCAYFNGGSSIDATIDGLPTSNSARTVSLWLKAAKVQKSYMLAYGYQEPSQYFCLMIGQSLNHLGFVGWSADYQISAYYDLTKWTHYLVTYGDGTLTMYANGKSQKTVSVSLYTGSSKVYLGSRIYNSEYFKGYIAAARIYNRVLSQDQITMLSKELKPVS